ncbi:MULTISPECIES: response regulator [Planktothricoides]|uniref:histidine kinase n=2 Tax=Planktothricoides raciborskii TaxID=132608 RepID=A0AAU8J9E6_9CYAN|nr:MULTISPECIES: response regulator [Planktothricoides]KOR35313.1 hypothetical protein AM228_18875 [Planktothricoides sp. SR001]MBD2547164.1 response regulator [Planktothricoides raciborskii FACHB-1370]MBD2583392.1 response regulator [Planktothricoides raciborskii FACHB-1261]
MNPQKHIGKILIVDDTPYNLKVLSNLLLQKGYEVRQALNGQIALKSVMEEPPDVILLDIIMPDMDGYQVCEQLKACEKTAKIPVIFLTVLDDIEYKVKAWSYGSVDYITKPFYFSEILIRIENQIKISLYQKELRHKNQELEQENQILSQINNRLIKETNELITWIARIYQEIKFPLHLIAQNLERLKTEYLPPLDAPHHANQIFQATLAMEQLINYLVDYACLIAPYNSLELKSISCQTILRETLKNLATEIQLTGATITYSKLPNIRGDRKKIKQLFEYLLRYALTFTRAEVSPEIKVFAEYRECQPEANLPSSSERVSERISEPDIGKKNPNTHGEWRLAIQDNGIGMAAKDLENIFASFPYLDESPEDRSMGMSLLICRKIVESYGGRFWVESTPGLGNCFYFTMPMQ